MIKSVVLTSARSGSNLLLSLLNSHPGFYFHGEVFHPSRVNTFRAGRKLTDETGVEPTELRNRDPVKFVDTVFTFSPAHYRVVGFKLFLSHNRKVIDRVVGDETIRIILLDRANRLASYSSKLLTAASRVWWVRGENAPEGEAKPEPSKVRFDPDEFEAYRAQLDRAYARVRERLAGRPHMHGLDYRDLQNEGKLREVARFLGVERSAKMIPGIVRQHSPDLLERFSNPRKVTKHLAAIGRSSWLEEKD